MSRAINRIMTRHKIYPRKDILPTEKHPRLKENICRGGKKSSLHTVLSSCSHRVTEHQILLDQNSEYNLSSFPPSCPKPSFICSNFTWVTLWPSFWDCFPADKTLPLLSKEAAHHSSLLVPSYSPHKKNTTFSLVAKIFHLWILQPSF